MKKALIICAGGMSSSLIAQKATEQFEKQGEEIEVEATSASASSEIIEKDEYDLYMVSPQTKMHFNNISKAAEKYNKPVVNIPPQAYVPIPMGTEKMVELILNNI
jgi:PTS system cellobiose-specific IIB component